MRSSLLALALVISGMSGSLQASKAAHPTHRVRRGETAARIARENGLSLADLEAANPKVNLGRLAAGTTLRLPSHPVLRKVTRPLPPLPATPALGPTSLTHLEKILPTPLRTVASTGPEASGLADLKPILPPATETPQAPGFEAADPDHLDLLWPVETRTISSAWGPRMRSRTVKVKSHRRRVRYRGAHKGVDLTAPTGTDVFAALDGRVIASGRQKDYGNYVILDHGNGVATLYGHHSRNFVLVGEVVRRGQKIAEVGRTGNATGPHLHFELRLAGAPQNPLPYLNDQEEIPADQMALNRSAVAPRLR